MKLDVLAIGSHPDDVELGCGGTLAQLAGRGRKVGILHLTQGEAGTRGSVAQRRQEAEEAANILGAVAMEFMDCGDGQLRQGLKEEDELIDHLRNWRPELVLGPAPADRHPDHGRAHQLVADCCFYAGLVRRGSGEPHRPAALFSYMQHDLFTPSFIVDVTTSWEVKLESLASYHSQLYQGDDTDDEPPTKVASREFRRAVEGRAQHYGLVIGAAYGEPFWSCQPLAIDNPLDLVPKGLR